MTLGTKNVLIDVTGGALEAAVVQRGSIGRRHSVVAAGEWTDETLAEALRACLGELAVKRARVDVMWRHDGAASTVVQTPVSGRGATGAAILTMIESGGIEPSREATGALVLAPTADGGSHVLISTVEQSRVDWLEGVIEDSGCSLGRVLAGESCAAVASIQDVRAGDGGDPVVSMVMGENTTAISVMTDGKVQLVRFADFGVSALTEAYGRALGGADYSPEQVSLASRKLLFETAGIPAPDIEIAPGVAATQALRVMQPALQRIAVELKQSLRFTLQAGARSRVVLRLVGPACSIANLEGLLAEQIEAEDLHEPAGSGGEDRSWIALAIAAGVQGWEGVETGLGVTAAASVTSRPFWAGVAAAALALVGVGFGAQTMTERSEQEIREVRSELEGMQGSELSEQESMVLRACEAAENAFASELGVRGDFGAALRLIAEVSAGGVGVESLSASRVSSGTSVRIRARAEGVDPSGARERLQEFVSGLDGSVLTSGVEVGSVRIIEEPEVVFASFDATVHLHEIAAHWLDEEGTP